MSDRVFYSFVLSSILAACVMIWISDLDQHEIERLASNGGAVLVFLSPQPIMYLFYKSLNRKSNSGFAPKKKRYYTVCAAVIAFFASMLCVVAVDAYVKHAGPGAVSAMLSLKNIGK